jgi:hypothetical protein
MRRWVLLLLPFLLAISLAPQRAEAQASTGARECTMANVVSSSIYEVMQPVNVTGLSFQCVVRGLMDGANNDQLAGVGRTITTDLSSAARPFWILAIALELLWILMYGNLLASQYQRSMPQMFVATALKALLVAIILMDYPILAPGVQYFAVEGASVAASAVHQAINRPSAAAVMVARDANVEQAQLLVSRWLELRDKITRGENLADQDLTAWTLLNTLVTSESTCRNTVDREKEAGRADISQYAGMVDMCRQLQVQRAKLEEPWGRWSAAVTPAGEANAGGPNFLDFLKAKAGFGTTLVVKLIAKGLSLLFGVITVGIVAAAGVIFVIFVAIGPLVIAVSPFHVTGRLMRGWASNLLAISLIPMGLSLVQGLWDGFFDVMIAQSSDSIILPVVGSFIIAGVTVWMAMMGYRTLNAIGGTAMAGVGQVASTVMSGVSAMGVQGGAKALGAWRASSGQGFGKRALSAMGGAVRGTASAAFEQAGAAGGRVANAMTTGDPNQGGMGKTVAQAAAFAAGAPARAMDAMRSRAARPAPSLDDTPRNRRPTDLQQRHEAVRAGRGLAGTMRANDDYRARADGGLDLTPTGDDKVSAYRSAHAAPAGPLAQASNADFVNDAGVRSGLTGVMPSDLDGSLGPNEGSTHRAIQEALPDPVRRARPGEPAAAHRDRLAAEARAIEGHAGGDWTRVDGALGQLRELAAREVHNRHGQRFGIVPQALSAAVPPEQRRYEGEAGSAFAQHRDLNPTLPDEELYAHVAGRVRADVGAPNAGEDPGAYLRRINDAVFLAQTR